jgi:hypothetical protein
MEVITGGIMQAKLSVALFPTNRLELPGFLLIHKFASLATTFRPVLLAHRLGFGCAFARSRAADCSSPWSMTPLEPKQR